MTDLLQYAIAKCSNYNATLNQSEYNELLRWKNSESSEGWKACIAISNAKKNGYRPFRLIDHRDRVEEESAAALGSKSDCYLTMACMCELEDNFRFDCEEMAVLREFLDKFIKLNNAQEIEIYNLFAPHIVDKINKRPESKQIYREIYAELINPLLDEIAGSQMEKAYQLFKDYGVHLIIRFFD